MKLSSATLIASLIVVAGCGGPKPDKSTVADLKKPEIEKKPVVTQADRINSLKEFIATNEGSKEPARRDLVTRTRIELGYERAKSKDFGQARQTFLDAAKMHRGTSASTPEFGGLQDQAAYQAAVCLVAMGKKQEAAAEFRKFLKDYPYSPLATAAYRRLTRLNGGTSLPEDDQRYQVVVSQREKNLKLEIAMCGPKCIENLLPRLGKPAKPYREIATLCGTTERGTTLSQLKSGLAKLGVKTYGFELNRKDFSACPTPSILLAGDHYVVLLKVDATSMTIFDTLGNSERTIKLPAEANTAFSATVLTLTPPNVS